MQGGLQALLRLGVSAKAWPTLTRQTELGSLAFFVLHDCVARLVIRQWEGEIAGCWFKSLTVLSRLQPHRCSSPDSERMGLLTENI